MAKKYTCNECGGTFSESEIDWEVSEKSYDDYCCYSCSDSLVQAGIDAMDPDGNGYDEGFLRKRNCKGSSCCR